MFNLERIVMEPELEQDADTPVDRVITVKIEKLFDFEPRGCYVYVHRKITNGEIFYVGKGKGDRGWRHYNRNNMWFGTARKYGVAVEIVYDNLTEEQALSIERDFIEFFGKRYDGTGCLTNFSDYGFSCPGFKGTANPNADKKVYHFVNVFTYESFIGIRMEMKEKKGVSMNYVLNGTCLVTLDGWTTMEILSTNNIRDLRKPMGISAKVHHFYNMETSEEFIGIAEEFYNKYKIGPKDMVSGNTLLAGDWCLYKNKHKWYSMQRDFRKFLFFHEDGRQYYCTRKVFERETGICTKRFFSTKANAHTAKGWRIAK